MNLVQTVVLALILTSVTTLAVEPSSWSDMSFSQKDAAARQGLGIQVAEHTDTVWGRFYKIGNILFQHDRLNEAGEYVRITGIQIFPQLKSASMTFMPFAVRLTPLSRIGSDHPGDWRGALPDLLWPIKSSNGIKTGDHFFGTWDADRPLRAKHANMRILEVFEGPYFIIQNTRSGETRLFRREQFGAPYDSSVLIGCALFGGL